MSIQNDLKRIEKEIEQLKSNELPIEDQIKRYADALKKVTKAKATIDALNDDITIIQNNHDNNTTNN
mgnify:CR=1 FL=1